MNKMKYKMIVMDMDDTLLQDDLTISHRTKKAIETAQTMGIKIILASGRPTYAMKKYAKELKMDVYNSFILSYNGAIIMDCAKEEILFEKTLPKEAAHELFEISKNHNVHIHTYVGDDIITPKHNEYTDIEGNLTGMKVIEVDNFYDRVDQNVVKVLMLEDPHYLKQVETKLRPLLKDKMSLHISKPFFLEFMDHGIDKSSSLERLIQKLGIQKEEVIAIGDSYNDLGMIRFAGLGVAMGNAPLDIQAEADYVTDSNMEDGIAKVIEKFIFNENA